jgi:CheY-like chemotaxis protein
MIFRAFGCAAEACCNPTLCVRTAWKVKPHLVLIDMCMPVWDGITVAMALQELPDPPRMIVALIGLMDSALQEDCGSAGFHSFIVKPMTIAVFTRISLGSSVPIGHRVSLVNG